MFWYSIGLFSSEGGSFHLLIIVLLYFVQVNTIKINNKFGPYWPIYWKMKDIFLFLKSQSKLMLRTLICRLKVTCNENKEVGKFSTRLILMVVIFHLNEGKRFINENNFKITSQIMIKEKFRISRDFFCGLSRFHFCPLSLGIISKFRFLFKQIN